MELTPEQLEAAEAVLREKIEAEALEKAKAELTEDNSETIEKLVTERLSKMKNNVDKAYEKLDAETREKARLEQSIKDLKRAQMEAEGKHLELAQMKTAELEEKVSYLDKQNLELTRDQAVKDILIGKEFRNNFARQTAFNAIVNSLVEDEERGWVHKSGVSIGEYFEKVFLKDPEHEILFKPKDNSGAGAQPSKSVSGKRPDSLKGMTTADLLAMAASGDLGEFNLN